VRSFSSLRSDRVTPMAEATQWDGEELMLGRRPLPVVDVGGWLQLARGMAVLARWE
jgi:hypothetical protein